MLDFTVTDADSGKNQEMSFSLIGDADKVFSVDQRQQRIRLEKKLDYEVTFFSYMLTLRNSFDTHIVKLIRL